MILQREEAIVRGVWQPTYNLSVKANTDAITTLGRTVIKSNQTDSADFSHIDYANGTDYALRQNSAGLTIINTPVGQGINFRIGHSTKASMGSSGDWNFGNNVTVQGNLTVEGSLVGIVDGTDVTVNDLIVEDQTISVNKGSTTALATQSGLNILGDSDAVVGYCRSSSDNTKWEIKAPGNAGVLTFDILGNYGVNVNANGDYSNWNLAYDYRNIGHLPITGGGLTGNLDITSTSAKLRFFETDGSVNENWQSRISTGDYVLSTINDAGSVLNNRLIIEQNGDMSLFGNSFKLESEKNTNIRLVTTKNDASWVVGVDTFGSYEFYGNDASGGGVGIKGAIRLYANHVNGHKTKMVFTTSSATVNDIDAMSIDDEQNIQMENNLLINTTEQVHSGNMSAIDDNGDKHITEVFTGTTFAGANGGVVAIIGAGVNIESTITSVSWSLDTTADHRLESIDSFSYCSFDGTNTLLTISNTYYPLKAITIYVTRKI